MSQLCDFKAVCCSGVLVPDQRTVTAMALLFSKVFLPSNVEAISGFAQHYRIETRDPVSPEFRIENAAGDVADPFPQLSEQQRATALLYLEWCRHFSLQNHELFGPLFETNAYENSHPMKVTLMQQGAPGERNTYNVTTQPMILMEEDSTMSTLVAEGYMPVVVHPHSRQTRPSQLDAPSAKQMAALLAMKSVEMLIPPTKSAPAETLLEARDRLKDHLPPLWSAMFKLTSQLRKMLNNADSSSVVSEAEHLVDSLVRPALIDLTRKMELERKNWFYKILSPLQKTIKVCIGNPPLTQQQLITTSLVLASDAAMSVAGHLRTIDSLKEEAGLTFLLKVEKELGE